MTGQGVAIGRGATLDEVRDALVGRTIVSVGNTFGTITIELDNGQAFDVDTTVACSGYCYGGSVEVEFDLRKALGVTA